MAKLVKLVEPIKPYLVGVLLGVVQVLLAQMAMAQAADTAFNKLTIAICSIVKAMRGPFGLAVVVIMFAIGAISLMIGGRRAIPLMVTAGVGGVILAAAPSFARIFITAQGNIPQGCQ